MSGNRLRGNGPDELRWGRGAPLLVERLEVREALPKHLPEESRLSWMVVRSGGRYDGCRGSRILKGWSERERPDTSGKISILPVKKRGAGWQGRGPGRLLPGGRLV